jgi:hypothetical protein
MRAGTRREYASLVDERGQHAGAAAATFHATEAGAGSLERTRYRCGDPHGLVLALIVGVILANLGETAF